MSAPTLQATTEALPNRRGRPRGQPAWNKGKKLDETHKAKIAQALKEKWKEEQHRSSVSESLRGNVPWNKGRSLGDDTKERMRRAKEGTVPTPLVRKKISVAQSGRSVGGETRAKLSESLRGKPKSEEHKQKIAISQRKRAAATRVLRAVEAVSRGETSGATTGIRTASKLTSKEKRSKAEILRNYKFQLAEYRALKEELEPWAMAFLEKYGRKPRLSDVEETRIGWLAVKFKQYMVLKNNLLTTLPSLRNQLDKSEGTRSVREEGQTGGSPETSMKREGRWAQAFVAAHEYSKHRKKETIPDSETGAHTKPGLSAEKLLSITDTRCIQAVNAAIEYRRKRASEVADKAKNAAEAARNITSR